MEIHKRIIPYREIPEEERLLVLPNFYERDQEEQVIAEVDVFRALAPKAWGPETIYPGDAYKYVPESPVGQCAITLGGLATWLVWREVVMPHQIWFNRGPIVDEDSEAVGDHHAHLVLDIRDPMHSIVQVGVDLTASQFERIDETQYAFLPEYEADFAIRGTEDEPLEYIVEKSDLFAEYDTGKFDWRMIDFLGHFYHKPTWRNIGRRAIRGNRNDLWLLYNSQHSRDEIFDRLEAVQPKLMLPKSFRKPASGKKVPRNPIFTKRATGIQYEFEIR